MLLYYGIFQERKRRRGVLANRAKRMRYKKNKKQKWRNSRPYFHAKSIQPDIELNTDSSPDMVDCEESHEERSDTREDSSKIIDSYSNVKDDCESEGFHLLPSIEKSGSNIKQLKKQTDKDKEIDQYIKERDTALQEAFQYRQLVESHEKELKEVKSTMYHRVSTVRDFWRDQILEGRSRSGAILKNALIKEK